MKLNAARSLAAGAWRRVAVLALAAALIAPAASAAPAAFTLTNSPPMVSALPGGGWQATPGAVVSPSEAAAGTREFQRLLGGKVPVFDPLDVPGKAGRLPVRAAQTVRVIDAAAAVARCLTRSLICAAAASAAYILYEKYRTKKDPAGDGLVRDPGQQQTDGPGFSCSFVGVPIQYGASGQQACAQVVVEFAKTQPTAGGNSDCNFSYSYEIQGAGPQFDMMYVVIASAKRAGLPANWCGNPTTRTKIGTMTSAPATVKACPPVVDFYDPRYSVRGGPPGPDGKCPSGNYVPIAPADAAQPVADNPPAEGDQTLPDALKDAVKAGESVPSQIELSGPESQTGSPTVKTTTDAGGTTTTTDTPSYQYHYDGDKITVDEQHDVKTTQPDGTSSTTTTTTQGPKSESESKDPCDLHPERVGCMGLGEPPTDRIPKSTKDVSFTPEALGLPAACPAPVPLPHGQFISYQTVCDGLTQARPLIIAIGFLMAGGIVVAALRS